MGGEDYGIYYNVVDLFFGMFTFLNGAMRNSHTQRFITVELGRGQKNLLSIIHLCHRTQNDNRPHIYDSRNNRTLVCYGEDGNSMCVRHYSNYGLSI